MYICMSLYARNVHKGFGNFREDLCRPDKLLNESFSRVYIYHKFFVSLRRIFFPQLHLFPSLFISLSLSFSFLATYMIHLYGLHSRKL